MTARSVPVPSLPDVSAPSLRRHSDRGLLWAGFVGAVVVHAAAICLPLPERGPAEPVEPKVPTILELRPWSPPPPPAPELPRTTVSNPARLRPMPMVAPPDLEPLVEPREAPALLTEPSATADSTVYEMPVAPPAPAGPVEEWTPGLQRPVPLPGRLQPAYPPLGRQIRVGGVVLLRAVITEQGEVAAIEVIRAPDPDVGFSEAAIDAVSTWRYEPGLLGGKPVAVNLTVRVEFALH